jgi:hypothetical protein
MVTIDEAGVGEAEKLHLILIDLLVKNGKYLGIGLTCLMICLTTLAIISLDSSDNT